MTKDAVKDAPRVDSDGHLTPEEEDELYRHYGLHDPDGTAGGDRMADDRVGDDRVGDDRGDRTGDDRLGDRSDDGTGHDAALAGGGAAAGAGLGAAAAHDRGDRDDRLGDDRDDDRLGRGRDDSVDDEAGHDEADGSVTPRHAATGDTDDRSVAAENGPEHVAGAGEGAAAGAGAGAAAGGVGQRDDTDRGDDRTGGQEAYRPGERTTRLKRYVVTERVVQTVEELPDDDVSTR